MFSDEFFVFVLGRGSLTVFAQQLVEVLHHLRHGRLVLGA